MTGNPPLEVRRRVEQILERLAAREARFEWVRVIRAVRLLDTIGTTDARQMLETLATGERSAPATQAARAALERTTPKD